MPKEVVLDWREYEELKKHKDEQWDAVGVQFKKIEEIVKLMKEPIPNETPEQRYARTYLDYKVWCIVVGEQDSKLMFEDFLKMQSLQAKE